MFSRTHLSYSYSVRRAIRRHRDAATAITTAVGTAIANATIRTAANDECGATTTEGNDEDDAGGSGWVQPEPSPSPSSSESADQRPVLPWLAVSLYGNERTAVVASLARSLRRPAVISAAQAAAAAV